jgi:putative transposase
MCRMLRLHPSGYYAWKAKPESKRAVDDRRLLGLLKQAWLESGGIYGHRKLILDMRDLGESCSTHHVAKLLRHAGLKAQRGYGRRLRPRGGAAAVINLYSRQVAGWSTGSRIDTQLALDALHMAVWRRRPRDTVVVHSDQGRQFTSHDWQRFLASHNLQPSMTRRGNCHDNAVPESFFQLFKRERIRQQTYATRQEARSAIFSYIEMFYNPIRRHSSTDGLSPIEFERRNSVRLSDIHKTLVDSVLMDIGLRVIWGIPHAEAHIFNQCGHWAQWEHADTFNRMVREFLAR